MLSKELFLSLTVWMGGLQCNGQGHCDMRGTLLLERRGCDRGALRLLYVVDQGLHVGGDERGSTQRGGARGSEGTV